MTGYCPASFWKGKKILFGVTGGIAAYKAAGIVSFLIQAGAEVQVVMTEHAQQFVGKCTFETLTRRPVYTDLFVPGEKILHISLVRECDWVVIAPATANIIGKMAAGIGDDLLSTLLLVDLPKVIVTPAMNTGMWENPIVQENLCKLGELGVGLIAPGTGLLACGERGTGRFPETEEFLEALFYLRYSPRNLAGKRILISAGPSREWIDPVRFLSNPATGLMGCALASAARARGAVVTLVAGPLAVRVPGGVTVIPVETALEMEEAMQKEFEPCDGCIMNAAVSDFRPTSSFATKLKKEQYPDFNLSLVPNPDILFGLGQRKRNQVLVGFCAETDNPLTEAKRKLAKKNLDLMVANTVVKGESGFAVSTNKAWIVNRKGESIDCPIMDKVELAGLICDTVASLFPQ